jgi:hypothetical protein
MSNRRTTRKSTNRISTPPPTPAETLALFRPKPDPSALYFDRSLSAWPIVQQYLKYHKRAIFFFTESSEARYTPNTIVSRPVLRWFDAHWHQIMAFCENTLETDKARMRFRAIERSNIYDFNSNLPRTESPSFSPYVQYERNLALCIRNDGYIEGFMLITTGDGNDVELDVLCTGPKGAGIGQLLIRALKRYTKAAFLSGISLIAVPSAVNFYKKQGFVTTHGPEMRWTAH